MTLKIQEMPASERPRERLASQGAAALSDSELIGILLRTGIPGKNAVELALHLLAKHGSLSALARCSVKEIASVKGIGLAKAVQLAAAFGLGARLSRESLTKLEVSTPEQIFGLLGQELRSLRHESLRLVLLDTRLRLMRVEEISMGSLTESVAHPREVFRHAIVHSAYAVILVHNHPSGDPSPSPADLRLTRRLAEGAAILQIVLHDHIIIGGNSDAHRAWYSFKEGGAL